MVEVNPIPVFGEKKNTSSICRNIFTEISVQMVSAPVLYLRLIIIQTKKNFAKAK